MKINQLLIASTFLLFGAQAQARVELSIHNNDLALVKDIRTVSLNTGRQRVYFDGVSAQLNPQSVFLAADGIKVVEKNYDYNLINKNNLLNHYIGKEVKAVTINPENGEEIIKQATVLANNNGVAVLKFAQGIEPNYTGKILFDSIPQTLSAKPQLQIVLDNTKKEEKELSLLYLTSGLSWKADYIAELKSDTSLNLSTWVTLTNNSGIDYENARIRLIAGEVNNSYPMAKSMVFADSLSFSAGAQANEFSPTPVGDYYSYSIDANTTIQNNQTKQVSLFNRYDVQFKKSYKFVSPLYIGQGAKKADSQKITPSIIFNLTNDADSNLNVLMPQGTIRFYEGKEGNTTFLGDAQISQTQIGESFELSVGKAQDFYAKGKVANATKISNNITDSEVEIEFFNSKDKQQEVIFEQPIRGEWRVVTQSIESTKPNSQTAMWKITIPASGSTVLKYTIRAEK